MENPALDKSGDCSQALMNAARDGSSRCSVARSLIAARDLIS
ncbi:hypothetical protein TNCT_684631, partial [Trichonephila clavata]